MRLPFRKQPDDSEPDARPQVSDIALLEEEIRGVDLTAMPWSTIMPANEVFLLQKAGYEPLQVVFGNVVYSMGMRGVFRSIRGAFKRGEMPDFTRMNRDAREVARARMLVAAKAVGGDGVVDATLDVQELADFLEVTMTGTAVRRIANRDGVSMDGIGVEVAVGA